MAENHEGRVMAVEGNDLSGYIGVSPEYMTYANETEAPLQPKDAEVSDAVEQVVADEEAKAKAADAAADAAEAADAAAKEAEEQRAAEEAAAKEAAEKQAAEAEAAKKSDGKTAKQ